MFNYREFEENEMPKIRQRLGLDRLDKAKDKHRVEMDALVGELQSMGVPAENSISMIAELPKKQIAKLEKWSFDMKTLGMLKKVCNEAAPSPWHFSNHEEIRDIYHDDGHDTIYIIKEASEAIEEEDAIFIVAARQALPVLIELVEAQEKMLLGIFGEWGGGNPDDTAQKVMDAQAAWMFYKNKLENMEF